MSKILCYAGIDSRDISPDTERLIITIAKQMAESGWLLRSGPIRNKS